MSSSANASDYATLLQGDHGFILAVGLTVLLLLTISFLVKMYFTWRRFNSSTKHFVLASDAIWLLAHILAFAYLGVRISTLGGLTEDSNALSPAEKDALANENRACQVLFILALYLSLCSVLCITLAIPTLSNAQHSIFRSPAYDAPFVVFMMGLLLCLLPYIGCDAQYIFQRMQEHCPAADARILPVIIVIMAFDVAVPLYWVVFLYRHDSLANAGRVTPKEPWPVTPFVLRLLIVGANIAYLDLYIRANRGLMPYFSIFYPELLSVLFSLTGTTAVSMNRILGKLNFASVAYTADLSTRSNTQSAIGGSNSGTRTGNNAQAQKLARRGRRGSAGSEIHILENDVINWEERTGTLSQGGSF